jgi:hypothetical protein
VAARAGQIAKELKKLKKEVREGEATKNGTELASLDKSWQALKEEERVQATPKPSPSPSQKLKTSSSSRKEDPGGNADQGAVGSAEGRGPKPEKALDQVEG